MDEAMFRFHFSLFVGLFFIIIGLNVQELSACFVPGSFMTSGALFYFCLMRRKIRFKTVILEKPEECIICFDTIDKGTKLDCVCRYFYHERCIIQWFRKKKECPVCKKNFD